MVTLGLSLEAAKSAVVNAGEKIKDTAAVKYPFF